MTNENILSRIKDPFKNRNTTKKILEIYYSDGDYIGDSLYERIEHELTNYGTSPMDLRDKEQLQLKMLKKWWKYNIKKYGKEHFNYSELK